MNGWFLERADTMKLRTYTLRDFRPRWFPVRRLGPRDFIPFFAFSLFDLFGLYFSYPRRDRRAGSPQPVRIPARRGIGVDPCARR